MNYNDSKRKMGAERKISSIYRRIPTISGGGMTENHYFATTTTKGIMQNNGLRFFKNVSVMKDREGGGKAGELFWIKRDQRDIRDTLHLNVVCSP